MAITLAIASFVALFAFLVIATVINERAYRRLTQHDGQHSGEGHGAVKTFHNGDLRK